MNNSNLTKKDIIFLTILFGIAIWIWTSPIQENKLPFGEGDAAWHFSIGDYIADSDKTITRLPNYIGFWYYGWNQKLGVNALEYPPPNHVNYALMQVGGGHRFVPIYIYKAIASFLGAFVVYFLLRRLFGFYTAALASFPLIFSLREMMTYLWGQQPTLISFTFIPATLYCSYFFLKGFYNKQENSSNKYLIYFYMLILILCSQFLLHIQGLVLSILMISPFWIFMIIKNKKIPLTKKIIKHYLICIFIIILLCLPFLSLYTGASPAQGLLEDKSVAYSRIFKWGVDYKDVSGSYPPEFITFSSSYTKYAWIFVLLGLAMIIIRRKEKDMLIISWIIGMYLALHLDLFGFSQGRIARMGIAEPQLIFSLIAIGLVFITNLILKKKQLLKIPIYLLFILAVVFLLGKPSYNTLTNAYTDIQRITPEQYEAALWINKNIPEDSILIDKGTFTIAKKRFIHVSSQRYIAELSEKGWKKRNLSFANVSYIIVDYSDLLYLQNYPQYQQQLKDLQTYELNVSNTSQLIYDQNNIHIYKRIKQGEESI